MVALKAARMVPRNFSEVLEIYPGCDTAGKELILHKDYYEFRENKNEELEYFFTYLLPRIDPPQTKYKNKKDYINCFFDAAFTISDEVFVCWY